MRRVLEHVVLAVGKAQGDLLDLLADRDHSVAETIQLILRLRLGRLDHYSAGHGEADRRRVESVVHQALGDILHFDSRWRLELAQIEYALVCDGAVGPLVEHRVVLFEHLRHVVGVQDGDLRGVCQPLSTHHEDVHP